MSLELVAKVTLPGMFSVIWSPTLVTLTPVPCSWARSLASCLVHVVSDTPASERTDAGRQQQFFAIATDDDAGEQTCDRTDPCTLGRLVDLLFSGIGVGPSWNGLVSQPLITKREADDRSYGGFPENRRNGFCLSTDE